KRDWSSDVCSYDLIADSMIEGRTKETRWPLSAHRSSATRSAIAMVKVWVSVQPTDWARARPQSTSRSSTQARLASLVAVAKVLGPVGRSRDVVERHGEPTALA